MLSGEPAEQGAAPDCQKPTLVPRSGFRQQVSVGVKAVEKPLIHAE
jgi:hypothetical protein